MNRSDQIYQFLSGITLDHVIQRDFVQQVAERQNVRFREEDVIAFG